MFYMPQFSSLTKPRPLTTNGENDVILNGVPDWVYEDNQVKVENVPQQTFRTVIWQQQATDVSSEFSWEFAETVGNRLSRFSVVTGCIKDD
ncbi:hypothetical protein CEXT_731941 [Caerostris extrusa]|uniref:Uncharacterized protein n=1 Tax=Caerostris extrusa TaxID=172846 RepID=A0AAV4QFI6_CAEEX|nr:hypothetical protein CEXT_731941 [Caerostris extrusa]